LILRIFVAGGTGVIGRRIVPVLVGAGYRVSVVSRSEQASARLIAQGASPIEVDLYDAESVRRAVGQQDVVINLATHIPPSTTKMMLPWAWHENDRVRRVVSSNLADAARAGGADCFIQESFAPIYEDAGDQWIDESWAVRPARYNRSVLDAERSANRFTKHGGRGIVLRFAYFYGPDSPQTHEMIGMVKKGISPVPGAPDAYISSVSHDDAAAAVVAAIHVPAGTYNVSDDEPLKRRDFIESLAKALGAKTPSMLPGWLVKLGGSTTELLSRSQRISSRKLRETSDWQPTVPSVREAWPSIVASTPPQEA
jgi:nucleoside-diphosphate-sugar epimerase